MLFSWLNKQSTCRSFAHVVHDCRSNLPSTRSPHDSLRYFAFCVVICVSFSLRVHAAGRNSKVLLSQFEQGATTSHDRATSPPEASQSTQHRASTSGAPSRCPSTAETHESEQTSRTQPATGLPATQAQPVQAEGSGYMSTESDSDTGTNKRTQVICWVVGVTKCPIGFTSTSLTRQGLFSAEKDYIT